MKKKLLAILLLGMFLLSACQSQTPTTPSTGGTVNPPKVYKFADTSDATTLNPHQALAALEDGILAYIMGALYRGIPSPDGKGSKLIPELAAADRKSVV